MWQQLLDCLRVENCFHSRSVKLWRRGRRCGDRVLTVELGDESTGDVDAVRDVKQRDLRSVEDHVDAAGLGGSLERAANLALEWSKEFLWAGIVSSLRVLVFTLRVFFELVQLIDLRLQRTLIDGRTCRRFSQLVDFRFETVGARLHRLDVVFCLLKLGV